MKGGKSTIEKFILLAAGLDAKQQLRLSLPSAKLFQPYAIKGGEPELKIRVKIAIWRKMNLSEVGNLIISDIPHLTAWVSTLHDGLP